MSRLRYTHSRLEDSEISTDLIEQIDEELESTAAALSTRIMSGAREPQPTPTDIQARELTKPTIPLQT